MNKFIKTNKITLKKIEEGHHEKRDVYPVSENQAGLFAQCLENPEALQYNIPFLFKLHPDVDLSKLKIAVEETIEAHSYIKARFFIDENGEIMQRRMDTEPFSLKIHEQENLDNLVLPFDIIEGRLFRTSLYKTSKGNYFFVDLHHMICDGSSQVILINDINQAYGGKKLKNESYTQFDAVLDEKKALKSDYYIESKAYFTSIFEGCDTNFLPEMDKNEPTPSRGILVYDPELIDIEKVETYCTKHNLTMDAFFMGVFGYVLARMNHKDYSIFATIYHGRNDPRIVRSSGMYVKTLPVYCAIIDRSSLFLKNIKDQVKASREHDIYSFAQINRDLCITSDVLVGFQGDSFEFDILGGLPAEFRDLKAHSAISPLTIQIFIRNQKFQIEAEFYGHRYSESLIKGLLKNLESAADQILDCDDLSEIKLSFNAENESFAYFHKKFSGLDIDSNLIYDMPENLIHKTFPDKIIEFEHQLNLSQINKKFITSGIAEETVFLAAFSYCLAKFTGQEEIIFCISAQDGNLLPYYIKIDEDKSSFDYLQEISKIYLETINNNGCKFEKLSEKLNIKADIVYDFQEGTLTEPHENKAANLRLEIRRKNNSFKIRLNYRGDLYKESTIKGFADFFKRISKEFLNVNNISEMPLISEEENLIYQGFNQTEVPYDNSLTIVDMLNNQIKKIPDNIALVYKENRLTYKELDKVTDRLAKHIKKFGIGREDVVSILLPKSQYMTISSIAVLKAGGAYQPLDPTYPKERLGFMVENCGAKLLIADESMVSILSDFKGPVILTSEIDNLEELDLKLEAPKPEDLFIVLYTSGSTGVPKGVMLEHRNVAAMCKWYHRYYGMDETARVTVYASFGFDANVLDTYPGLTIGASLYIIGDHISLDLIKLNDYFEKNQITNAFMTTQVAQQFAANIENHCLKHLSTGGEKLSAITPPDYQFHNLYGPTETTVLVSSFLVDGKYQNIPIGKAIDNVKLYVLDKFARRVPLGTPGELCISGMQVSRGYLNDPEKTNSVFTKNPYCKEKPYDRIYHTGDIVRYLPSGDIEFVGRRDGQVKIRGFRIELTEIEAVIREFEGIKDVTVQAFDEPGGGKYIAAYIVSDKKIDIDGLNSFIESKKPSYMVPLVTMQIDKIPLNQNMKVNKKELPPPVKKTENLVKPENKIQKEIFDCVTKVLGHDEFGIFTDFQDAGFSSIGIVSLNVLLSKTFGIVVKTRDLRENNTIAKLEKFIAEASLISKEEPIEKQETYPILETQMGLFVESISAPQALRYNIAKLFKLHPDVDLEKLKIAVESAIDAHFYIKTRFFMDDNDEILQKRQDDEPFIVKIRDFMDINKLVKPFKIVEGRLFDSSIYKTKEGNFFFIDIHHLICDGTSLAVFLDDINRAYSGEKLESETYSGFEAALDEKKARQSDFYNDSKVYYASVFESCDTDFLLKPDKNGDITPGLGSISQVPLELDLQSVKTFCDQKKITLNAFFVSVFGFVLGRYNRKNNSVFTTIYNGRNDSRIARSAGMYVKTLPVYCDLNTNVSGLLTTTKEQLLNSMDHDIYSFAEISRAFGINADIIFGYQGDNFNFDTIGNLPAEDINVVGDTAIAPISVLISIKNEKSYLESYFRSDMYEDRTIDALLKNFVLAARQMLVLDDLSKIKLLFDEEKQMVNDPKFYGQTFTDLFSKAVAKYPDNIAVKDKKGTITYKEMDLISDEFALMLIDQGLEQENFVGVLSGRTREFIIGAIAAMKAGGAYVPLDPEYPKDRLQYMLEDSDSQILFCTSEYKCLTDFYTKKIILLDEASDFVLTDKTELKGRVLPENLAYMIYTSGSTGKPKGVMISHSNLSNLIFNDTVHHKLDETTKCSQHCSFAFDASVIGIFPPLANGCSIYLFAEEDRKDPAKVCEILKKEAVNYAIFPTQMGEIILENLNEGSSLNYLFMGGEKLKRYYKRPYTIVNAYGPTESTVATTLFNVDQEYKNIPIGKSLINVRSYVVDEDMNEVPVGASGELCHSGRQIARGYLNLKKKTEEVFVPNPFSVCEDDEVLYHTGDMVKKLGDGTIEYIGRIDSQVKIRGYRIELGEIEGAMITYPSVGQTAVTVCEQGGNKYIVGYYTCDVGEIDPKIWNIFLQPLLPEYMIPNFYVHLDKMKVTPGGKTDKKALPKPKMNFSTSDYLPPETELQNDLCNIFETVLGVQKVGINDDFFALGGTSITAAKVAMKCMSKKIEIVFSDIFEYKTVKNLEEFILSKAEKDMGSDDAIKSFNYEFIKSVLEKNTPANFNSLKSEELGDIIITGATGFLGIHVLKEFLDNYDGKITCFIRKGRSASLEKRIKSLLFYYFENDFEDLFGKRIFCVNVDITDIQSVMALENTPGQTLINCAACVKHFVADDSLVKINVTGVENLLELCKKTNRQFIQISTVSVGGDGKNGFPPIEKQLKENDLYFGQILENAYVNSKFLAERAVLSAIAENGVKAKIMRVGNLMSRNSDGEFQINFLSNGFMRSLKGYKALGKFPVSGMNTSIEFSPIDITAHSILKLAQTNPEFTVFHPYNNHVVRMADVIKQMNENGFNIEVVNEEEFAEAMKTGMENPEIADSISGLIVYLSSDTINTIYPIPSNNQFTSDVLYRLNFSWPITNENYLYKALKALNGLGFFDIGED